ncbi:ABC transporter ATP-binding protein [Ornithinibacillus massiliensis]|uniref:ABC transporter ATP-binding protein n=1 Tax=Ornithinibacillus massiliensis TaxID=1944633 RepID=A0ABS5MGS4_9BACI|nr:ABC transporter ATP-binding protein [Ornithinibacillus massiliensis]MBS3681537.1 ABC transporter ATP-binding protein [Ornithinibacillus massiliensis]
MNVLDVHELHVDVLSTRLLNNVSFSIEKGSVVALVGHNGAGKSTLMKTIMGIQEKSNGEITLEKTYSQDKHFLEFKRRIAFIPEEPLLMSELTAMQHFQLYGKSYGIQEGELMKRIERYIEGFELTGKLDEYPESLSKGMRQKVQTICAMLPDVPLLLIDEPFMGLDIYAIDYFEELLKEKIANGTAILLTTHQLERVKGLANQFIMLQEGELLHKGLIEEFETIKRRSDV